MKNRIFILVIFLLLTLSACKTARNNPWAAVTSSTGDGQPAQIFGGYSSGCLSGAMSLAPDGPGYQIMRITRRRFYGHPSLVSFIKNLGKTVKAKNKSVVLIGDMGQPRGGPTNSNHLSHQTGLDVDIWYWQMPEARQRSLTLDEREQISAPSMISIDGETVNSKWSHDQIELLKATAEAPEVDRIFVSPAIKRAFCKDPEANTSAWLQKLRPWWDHHDHCHVRLKCPSDQTECISQPALPAGTGCDETLDWWFSAEAKEKAKTAEKETIPALPILPASCEKVLQMNK